MLHEHPIKILRYTAKNLWLLIFPLLRSAHFFPFSAKEIAAWLHGAWFDLLICVLILTYGAIRWYFCGFMYNTEVIRRQSGILLKRETEIPCSSITSVTEEHAFFSATIRSGSSFDSHGSGGHRRSRYAVGII